MASVADALRSRTAQLVMSMTPEERVALALSLGDQDLDAFAAANGLNRAEALRRLCEAARRGRRPSRSADSF